MRTVDEAKENLARLLEHRGISRNDPHVNQAVHSLMAAIEKEPPPDQRHPTWTYRLCKRCQLMQTVDPEQVCGTCRAGGRT